LAPAGPRRKIFFDPSKTRAGIVTCGGLCPGFNDVIRSLAVSQRRLGTREVMLIHHTDCGMQTLTDDGFRAELLQATGVAPAFAIESFTDLDADLRQSLLRVRRSPFLAYRDQVRGFVYDVGSQRLREVVLESER